MSKAIDKDFRASPLSVYCDGLDAAVDGRGFGPEHEAARRLLEAAPDLLEALKATLEAYRLHRPQVFGTDAIEHTARTAIAKAEGNA